VTSTGAPKRSAPLFAIVAGAYAIYEHTGIYRKTKDLDLFFEPSSVVAAARALRDADS
jgi:hypothetical protein